MKGKSKGRKRKVLNGAAARSVLAKTNADQATLAAEAHPNDPAVHIAPQIAAEARNKKPKHTIQSFTAQPTEQLESTSTAGSTQSRCAPKIHAKTANDVAHPLGTRVGVPNEDFAGSSAPTPGGTPLSKTRERPKGSGWPCAKAGNDCGSHIGSSQPRPTEPRVMAHGRRRTKFSARQLRSNVMNALYAAANVIFIMRNCSCNCAALLRVAINLIKHKDHQPKDINLRCTWESRALLGPGRPGRGPLCLRRDDLRAAVLGASLQSAVICSS